MQAVQSTTGADLGTLAPRAAAADAAASGADVENRFLTLLVTQLKNQDPLNPMDNAQLTTQLAQISTVTGIEKLNASLTAFAASSASMQSLQAASILGESVLVPGATLALQGGAATGGVALDAPADRVVVTVTDAAGNVVKQIDLGAQPAGIATYTWDGSGAGGDGTYQASIAATRGSQSVDATALAAGRVTAVSPAAGGARVAVAGVGEVALSDVKQVRP